MSRKFPEYKGFNLSQINKEVLDKWTKDDLFKKSLESHTGRKPFVFYEGPPSANGMPGIHHVISRSIKDIFCRYKTLKGYKVERKAGWDTHGLPVELSVENKLGITKDDIGNKISVKEYNDTCRKEVMKYTKEWEDLTRKMGYWIDMDNPYITYDNRYIESVWYLLKELYNKGLLYKGFTIQPFSPAAGTGLSSHELNQPGAYRDVKDTTCVAQFKCIRDENSKKFFDEETSELFILAWTTTPWTLPSNTALAVGNDIDYVKIKTYNPYSGELIYVILAKNLISSFFDPKSNEMPFEDYKQGDKKVPYQVISEFKGSELTGIKYEQLIDWIKPKGNAFEVVPGDFVTTEDGTGIVHIAPTFGADDYRVANQNNIAPLTVVDKNGNIAPLVDRTGKFYSIEDLDEKFISEQVNSGSYKTFAGRFVKNQYDETIPKDAPTIDVDIAVMLKKENRAFRIEKHVHTYPHCWRTDKPVLYYPLDSWFVRTTSFKDKLVELNKTINWKPESTGSGRFGKWLENLVDWNLSRSRFWGTPLPIWMSEDKTETKCIGSVQELKQEIDKSVRAGFMKENPLSAYKDHDYSKENYDHFDLHRPFVDEVILVSDNGTKLYRETDLIDVWFDSGAMPYAQVHYPFSTDDDQLKDKYPADFIAEGVDQTRGWFFTLHTIATMLFDTVAYKNIVSNGLVLDKEGNKMSKRLGNAVDPFDVIEKHGSDPLRWYMISNAQPWDNLKFNIEGVEEVKRKFFGTLYNTYSFFALYANVDGFTTDQTQVPVEKRPRIDRWILSLLNSLIKEVDTYYNDYEPTRAARAIQEFVIDNLSNWYVRLNRKRYWGGEINDDKLAAYQTLYTCLKSIAIISSPIMPFFAERLYLDLDESSNTLGLKSVHNEEFPKYDINLIDLDLEEQMGYAQTISSMVLSLRRKSNLKVRQPLDKIMIPIVDKKFEEQIHKVADLIQSEVNVKNIEFLTDTSNVLVKKIKPNFKVLGPKIGKKMKEVSKAISAFTSDEIAHFESKGEFLLKLKEENLKLQLDDVDIISEDIPGWLVANEGKITVALDVTITDELRQEGIAREFVNRIQNYRKESGLEVTDKISVRIQTNPAIEKALRNFEQYIGNQTLAENIALVDVLKKESAKEIEIDDDTKTLIQIEKI